MLKRTKRKKRRFIVFVPRERLVRIFFQLVPLSIDVSRDVTSLNRFNPIAKFIDAQRSVFISINSIEQFSKFNKKANRTFLRFFSFQRTINVFCFLPEIIFRIVWLDQRREKLRDRIERCVLPVLQRNVLVRSSAKSENQFSTVRLSVNSM